MAEAREKKFTIDWNAEPPVTPRRAPASSPSGTSRSKHLVPYIDWTPFFMAWELAGKFPKILSDEVVGSKPPSCTPMR